MKEEHFDDLKEITEKRLNYTKIPCDLIIAGSRKEQNAFLFSLLSDKEKREYYVLLDIEEKRIELALLKTKIEKALRLEDSMEII